MAIGYRSSETDAKETVAALEAVGMPGLAVHLDTTDESSVQEAFRRISDEAGAVTGLVNNAGFSQDGLLVKYSMATYDRVMATNVRGAFLCTQAALRGHAPRQVRAHRQHVLRRRPARQRRPDRLCRIEDRAASA